VGLDSARSRPAARSARAIPENSHSDTGPPVDARPPPVVVGMIEVGGSAVAGVVVAGIVVGVVVGEAEAAVDVGVAVSVGEGLDVVVVVGVGELGENVKVLLGLGVGETEGPPADGPFRPPRTAATPIDTPRITMMARARGNAPRRAPGTLRPSPDRADPAVERHIVASGPNGSHVCDSTF
jgi:hypothetical protein